MRYLVAWFALGVAPGLVSCAGPQRFAAPAPAGAVECAVREAQRLGYVRMGGEAEKGAVRVGLPYLTDPVTRVRVLQPPRSSDQPPPTGPELADVPVQGQLRFRYNGGQLRIEVISVQQGSAPDSLRQSVPSHAQQILALCSAPT